MNVMHSCNTKEFFAKELIKKFNVETICTTDDPIDSLEFHKQLIKDKYAVNVFPAFRPDRAMNDRKSWIVQSVV